MEEITLQEYWDELDSHDWYYDFSDDFRVWSSGKKSEDALMMVAQETGNEYMELFKEFRLHMFSGRPWGTDKHPKPERPSD